MTAQHGDQVAGGEQPVDELLRAGQVAGRAGALPAGEAPVDVRRRTGLRVAAQRNGSPRRGRRRAVQGGIGGQPKRDVDQQHDRQIAGEPALEEGELLRVDLSRAVVDRHEAHAAQIERIGMGRPAAVERQQRPFAPLAAQVRRAPRQAGVAPVVVAGGEHAGAAGGPQEALDRGHRGGRRVVDVIAGERDQIVPLDPRALHLRRERIQGRIVGEQPVHPLAVAGVRPVDLLVRDADMGVGHVQHAQRPVDAGHPDRRRVVGPRMRATGHLCRVEDTMAAWAPEPVGSRPPSR